MGAFFTDLLAKITTASFSFADIGAAVRDFFAAMLSGGALADIFGMIKGYLDLVAPYMPFILLALYAVLAEKGFFEKEELKTLRKTASRLQGHPDMKGVPGVDMSTGSLGLGISTACGMALSAKVYGKTNRVYTIVGDGESEEGQVWEAAMFAAHYKLDNLVAVLDWNGLQIDGAITEVMNPTPHDEKFRAFGWHVISIDAHNFDEIEAAFLEAKTVKGKPTVIIAKSVKGKGVSYMENACEWHGQAPKEDLYKVAMEDLGKIAESLK